MKKIFSIFRYNPKNPIPFLTAIIASATIVNAIVALLMWLISYFSLNQSEKFFETTNRPFIGIKSIDIKKDEKNKILFHSNEIVNYGNIPAKNLKIITLLYFDDNKNPKRNSSKANAILFPNISVLNNGKTYGSYYDSIFVFNKSLKMSSIITYQGANNHEYKTIELYVYDRSKNSFIFIDGDWY